MLASSSPWLLLFWRHQKRLDRSGAAVPIPPAALSGQGLMRSLLAAFFFYALAAFFLTFAIYQHAGLEHHALTASLAGLPLGVGLLLGALGGANVSRQLGLRTASVGMGVEIVGLVWVAALALLARCSWLPCRSS